MHSRIPIFKAIIGPILLLTAGCAYGGNPAVWTNEVTEELTIDTSGLARIEARTHNGTVTYTGQDDDSTIATVVVTKKGGGMTLDDAQEALDAIEVVVESRGSDAKRIAWKWKTPKKRTWGAYVSYKIDAPAKLGLDIETHNGPINATGVQADAKIVSHNGVIEVGSCQGQLHAETHNGPIKASDIQADAKIVSHNGAIEVGPCQGRLHAETHNGPITAESSGVSLRVITHNGKITATFAGKEANLTTHNGRIDADLSRCGALSGNIVSHNGAIRLIVGNEFSADATCVAHNGSIRCNVPWQVHEASRRRLTGRFGDGGSDLKVTIHNGSIRINAADDD